MILKGTANRGVKLLGTEVGAWMSDGINNDFQIVKNLPSHWTKNEGAGGGNISILEDTITIVQLSASTMFVHSPISCTIGDTYSVSAFALDNVGPASFKLRVSDDTNGGADRIGSSTTSLGLITVTFTATQTTHYVTLLTVDNDTTVVLKNEVEIRTAEIVTGAELHTYANAASDPNGNEANATTGFTAASNAVLSSVASPVDVGTYAISVENNTTPTAGGNASLLLNDATIDLQDDEIYIISFRARHNGTGGIYRIALMPTTVASAFLTIVDLNNTDTTYTDYSATFVFSNNHKYFAAREQSGTNDGGCYIDNLSIRKAIPDLSGVNLGLAIYGSLNKHVVNVNADTVSYSGFSNTDYARQPYNSSLDFGTGDFSIMFWFKSTATTTEAFLSRQDGAVGAYVAAFIVSSLFRYTTSGIAFSGTSDITDNVWHMAVMQRISGNAQIYIDKVLENSSSNSTSLTNTSAYTNVGEGTSSSAPATNTEMALVRMSSTALTESQIKTIYNSEKLLFQRDSVHQVVDLGLDLNIERPSAINETPGGIRSSIPSDDGTARESIFQRRQKTHSASSGPVEQKSVKYITNFLDTVNEGQAFSYDPYGTENAPCDPKFVWLESASYQPVRDGDTNWFTTSWTMLERN